MLVDSLNVIPEDQVARLHGRPSGKIHRGFHTSSATATIPSKYQTYVINNTDKKGFLSKSRRFCYDSVLSDCPGPAAYVGQSTFEDKRTSYSKRGFGGLVTKDRRIMKAELENCAPGPGSYDPPINNKDKRDFNTSAVTSNFHAPIAQVPVQHKWRSPAPNAYQVNSGGSQVGKTNNVSADSAFKSTSKREVINMKEESLKPSPCQYTIDDDLVKHSTKVPYSSFRSRTIRQFQPDPDAIPGPGTYHPFEPTAPVRKAVFPKKHYLCISAPALPMPPPAPGPGPGAYDLVDFQGAPKHYMSSAAFVSTSKRNLQDIRTIDLPGPAHYRPQETKKQSFFYNAAGRWM